MISIDSAAYAIEDVTVALREVPGEAPVLVLGGAIEHPNPSVYMDPLFADLDAQLRAAGAPQLVIDVSGLEFMNSSGIKALIRYVMRLAARPPEERYHLTFVYAPETTWQHGSLKAVALLARGGATLGDGVTTRPDPAEDLLMLQQAILELVGLGAPLAWVLEALGRGCEAHLPGMRAAVHLVVGDRLQPFTPADRRAPLPPDAPTGLPLAAPLPSCEAARTGRPVVVADACDGPTRAELVAVGADVPLRAIWSQPITDASGRPVGALALYGREPGLPDAAARRLLLVAARLAGIAVQIDRRDAELARRAEDLEGANARLVSADRLKDEFLSVISHELRGPLNIVLGYLDMLEQGIMGELSPGQADALAEVARGADRIHGLVENLIDATRLAAGTLAIHPQPVPVARILAETAEAVAPQAAARGLALEAEPVAADLLVAADEARARQALACLLDNAIKFTPAGGRVTLRAMRAADHARIEVRDTGPGLTEAVRLALLEQPGALESGLARRHDGVGLGLRISKGLVEAHGGALGVESQPGAGATFWLTLPLAGG